MLREPTQEEFERLADDVIVLLVQEATMAMQRRLKEAGVVLTGELANSLHHQSVVIARDLYAEFSIGFAGYGRFKDMRQLLFTKMPPIAVMEEYVREIGLEKFTDVPGYLNDVKKRSVMTDSRAINRIAWGIAVNIRQNGKLSRTKKGAFYNKVRGKLVYQVRDRMMETLPLPILSAIKRTIEGED